MLCPYCGREHHHTAFDSHVKCNHNDSHQEEVKNLLKFDFKKPKQSIQRIEGAIKAYKVRQNTFNRKIGVPKNAEQLTAEDKMKNLQAHGKKLVTCKNCNVKIVTQYFLRHIVNECVKVTNKAKCPYCETEVLKNEIVNHIRSVHPQYVFPDDLSAKKLFRTECKYGTANLQPKPNFSPESSNNEARGGDLRKDRHVKPGKSMDASKDYAHPIREHGRFGSHPSHDNFDDDSTPD